MDIAQSKGTETPYHEGLHWQRVGEPNVSKGTFQERENAIRYLQIKTNNVLKKKTPLDSDIRKPEELHAHAQEAGRALGIAPFAPYPGDKKVKSFIERAVKYDSFLRHLKTGNKKDLQNVWKLLTGNYIPALTGVAESMYLNNNE